MYVPHSVSLYNVSPRRHHSPLSCLTTPPLPSLFSTHFLKSSARARDTCNSQLISRVLTIAIHSLTDTCFRKCIPAGTVKNGKLDKYEEPCMRQCVDRFLDANMVVLRELERLRG